MNKILVILSFCFSMAAFAQNDSVSLGAGATDMVFYNMGTGAKTTASNQDWDIAFTVRPALPPYTTNQAAAIRINEAFGLRLYRSPNQKLSAWSAFDTAGYTGWQQMHNPDTTWTIGAFNINKDFANDYNYGWGSYAFAQHNVVGDSSIYLLQLPDGSFRKFAILNLIYDTAFNVQFDKLDNSDFTAQEVRKKPYRTKSFVYYSLTGKTIMDKEPAITDWDMVFLRYNNTAYNQANLTQDMGILTNDADATYAGSNIPAGQICNGSTRSKYINTIGKTWRDEVTDTLIPGQAYFITSAISGERKFVMTEFDGSYNGLMAFDLAQCAASTGIADVNASSLTMTAYPVPASEALHIALTSENESAVNIQLLDMSGRSIMSQNTSISIGENNLSLDLAAIQSGNYILSVSSEMGKVNRMISIVK